MMILMINFLIFLNKSWRIMILFRLLTFLLNLFKRKPLWLYLLNFWNSYYLLQERKINILLAHWLNFICSKTIANWFIIGLWRKLSVMLSILYFYRKFGLLLGSNLLEIVIYFTLCSLPTWPLCIISLCIKLFWLFNLRNYHFRNTHLLWWILNK